MAKKAAKSISTEKIKNVLKNRHDEIATTQAYAGAKGEENIAYQLSMELDVVRDIIRDLLGAGSYTSERVHKRVDGVDFMCQQLVWKDEM